MVRVLEYAVPEDPYPAAQFKSHSQAGMLSHVGSEPVLGGEGMGYWFIGNTLRPEAIPPVSLDGVFPGTQGTGATTAATRHTSRQVL